MFETNINHNLNGETHKREEYSKKSIRKYSHQSELIIDGNEGNNGTLSGKNKPDEQFIAKIRWPDLLVQLFIHIGFLYGFYLVITEAMFYTILYTIVLIYASGFGITGGVHRLWSHRSYKAKWPLRLLLIILFTITGQRDAYTWALDHRVHHKYTETDADPHNVNRGFFFAHVGWLVLTPHPKVEEKRKTIDMSDLEEDGLVMWQRKYYLILFPIFVIILPVYIPVYFWNESLWTSFWVNFNFRFCITLNIAFFVNSVAHMWGSKPYDKYISSVESIGVSIAALGEGYHNYHHVFPWDYKTGELGNRWNPSTDIINIFGKIGWAYDMKSASAEMVIRRSRKTGDGSPIWGFGDKDIDNEELIEIEKMERKHLEDRKRKSA